ncbi:hypothetical protein HII31_10476, partial [Pseudocercospora fuligena]
MHPTIYIAQVRSMYRPQQPPMDPEEVEAVFAAIDEKIQESTPANITVNKSDIPEDDAVLSSLHSRLFSRYQARLNFLQNLIVRINAVRSQLHGDHGQERVLTDRSQMLTPRGLDDLTTEQRREYLSYVPIKVIVDLEVEIEAKHSLWEKTENDLKTQIGWRPSSSRNSINQNRTASIMAQPQIPKLKEVCQTLDQKISNSQPGNIIVTQTDIPLNFIRVSNLTFSPRFQYLHLEELALHLLNEFEDSEEKLKKAHKEVEELGVSDQLTDWRADGNFKSYEGVNALDDSGLQGYLLHILVQKI